jgi:CRISPR-associated protein Csx10
MLKIRYKITTLSSILFSKESGDRNMTETVDYIPGRVILGIFAGRYIYKNKSGNNAHEDKIFKTLFLKDNISFSNAYLKPEDNKKFLPTPLSIQNEKENKDSVYDLLFKTVEDDYIQTKYSGGYSSLDENYISNISVDKSLNFHHARDVETGTSKEGIIFNYESINKDQLFEGYITGEDELINTFLEIFEKEFIAYTGRSRTSQYGKIRIEFFAPEKIITNIESQKKTSITFLSNVIIYNDYGTSECNRESLENYLKRKISNDIIISKSFIKPIRVDNYISIWKLKKPSENCFVAGTCFLLEGIKESDLDKLKELENYGIGERRNEGFGKIAIGLQKNEKLTTVEYKQDEISKPQTEIPQITKDFIKNSIKDIIVREIKTKAITDSKRFNDDNKGKITKSLIGRLESFVKGSVDFNNFKEKLNKDILRKPAKDQLENCKIGNNTFYEYLNNTEINVSKVMNSSNFNSLSDELLINIYNPSEDSKFNKELFKKYYLTFFAFLRKLIKSPKHPNKKENDHE